MAKNKQMKKYNQTSAIIIMGIIILCVFSGVVAFNLIPNNLTSDSYYAKVDERVNAKIEALEMVEHKLELVTSGDIDSYCIKTTRSNPNANALCWTNTEAGTTVISVLAGKKYYLWIKDTDGNISSPRTIER